MTRQKIVKKIVSVFLVASALLGLTISGCTLPTGAPGPELGNSKALASNNPDFTANVMAPLKVTDFASFDSQLQTVKNYGVNAVSVDIWWGDVEKNADNSFDWTYYDNLFSRIKAKGLKIVPILSFHQCGGNVGDTYTSVLPSWLWTKYNGQTLNGVTLDLNGLKHKSEQGNFSPETVQGWADNLVLNEYNDFTANFVSHYGATYASDLQEINVSLGPAGELRYPSYNSHDTGTGYPSRGALQSYSSLAIKDFQTKILAKYGNLAGVNSAWGTSLVSATQILPPSDANGFFTSGNYKNTAYGRDFIDWYNQSLVDHGKRVVDTVVSALGTSFPSAKIGYKIPGVHWAIANPAYPRAAEVAAGLIQTSLNMDADATGHGYQKIIGLAKTFAGSRSIVLHFTCLEMDNQNWSPQYSLAKDLVFWVANNAGVQGVAIKGENALSGGITGDAGWNLINNAFDFAPYIGFTTLRIGEVSSGTGQARYSQFIAKYKPAGWPSLFVRGTNNAWGSLAMTKSGSVWSVNNVSFGAAAGQGFKFDVYGDWSLNYGGSGLTGTAVQGGGNIAVASNASYNISFDESTKAYSAVLVSPVTYSISGQVTGTSVSGVTVTAGSKSALTDASGNFSITGLANGTYTVTPSKSGLSFTPSSRSVSISGANLTGVNFTASTGGLANQTLRIIVKTGANSESIKFPGDFNSWNIGTTNQVSVAPNTTTNYDIAGAVITSAISQGSNAGALELQVVNQAGSWANAWAFGTWTKVGCTVPDGKQITIPATDQDVVTLTIDIATTTLTASVEAR